MFGQLGHGDNENYPEPVLIRTLQNVQVTEVSCGWQHTMARSSDNRVFSWGYGEDGQLGHGDTADHLVPTEI